MSEGSYRTKPELEQVRRRWKAHIERWKQSGQTQVAYCRNISLYRINSPIGKKDLTILKLIFHLYR